MEVKRDGRLPPQPVSGCWWAGSSGTGPPHGRTDERVRGYSVGAGAAVTGFVVGAAVGAGFVAGFAGFGGG